ncbi:cyclase family protein [Peribacillus sp. TH24]|uniref:cyclase family protein n=1 Tax=Peribacillus sp. TH24 TaxID=2798483 RepID=UPI001913B6C4|nr:cyclase family protein [Peribacillus sp. TH24]MBK5446471.1 cyclase family protein [Peribacillus sp. TH24]
MLKIEKIVDLSLQLTNDTPIYPGDPEPNISVATTLEMDGYNLLHIHLGSQTGSHVDAPYHFISEGQRIDESDLRLFIGIGVIIPVTEKGEEEAITLKDVEPYLDQLASGKIVLFYTGWSRYVAKESFFRHPYVYEDVIHEMIKRGIRTFFIDTINIDRTGGTEFPIHDAVARVNGIIAENLTNFGAIDFPNPLISAFPLRIVGADGSPVRAVAMKVDYKIDTQKN